MHHAGMELRTLSAADHLLHVCVHGCGWDMVPPLCWIADATMILGSGEAIVWQCIVALACANGLARQMVTALSILQEVSEAPIPDAVLESCRRAPSSWLQIAEHRLASREPIPVLTRALLRYVRYLYLRRTAGPENTIRSFPRYLQHAWGEDTMWAVPARGLSYARSSLARHGAPRKRDMSTA